MMAIGTGPTHVTVIYKNGRRVKLSPKEAEKLIKEGWAQLAEDDELGLARYEEYLAGKKKRTKKTPAKKAK